MPSTKRREIERLLREMGWQSGGLLWWHNAFRSGVCNLQAAVHISNGWLREQDCPIIEM